MPQSWDMGQILLLPLQGRHVEDFYAGKNPTASAGFEPANSGARGQHANHSTTEAVFCRCSLFPSWSGYGLISTPGILWNAELRNFCSPPSYFSISFPTLHLTVFEYGAGFPSVCIHIPPRLYSQICPSTFSMGPGVLSRV